MSRMSRRKAIRRRNTFVAVCIIVLLAVIAGVVFGVKTLLKSPDKENLPENNASVSEKTDKEENKEPYLVSSATVINTGDIMVHSTQLEGAVTSGGYDFSDFFKYIKEPVSKADLGVANLEVTFGGEEAGSYKGYPAFNTPDILADNLKTAGFDLLLNINNHAYDTGYNGMKRTISVIKEKGFDFVGARENPSDKKYIVKNVNGIKLGITAFSYQRSTAPGNVALNANPLSDEAAQVVNVFSYEDKESFNTEAKSVVEDMKKDGADKIIFYMHWGEEYQLSENPHQQELAQMLCDDGVDIIVGSHPHVIQPVKTLTSTSGTNKTICVYSMGNGISNQRQEIMHPECTTGHTEDGMLLSYKFDKYSDGTVKLSGFDILPTWVNKYRGGSGYLYSIIPLDTRDSGSASGLSGEALRKSRNSYDRTKKTVETGLTEIQQEIGCEVRFK